MDISTIQKRKFLQNIYKLYLSGGNKPSEQEIRSIFNTYFSINKLGQPINVDYQKLEAVNIIDPFILNELMAHSIFNLEVLYDCLFENNNETFEIISILNKKLENLRSKRSKLEDRIDQILFENSNTDGFFYSYSDNFADISKVDLDLTTAHIDIVNNKVDLPFITSEYSTAITKTRYVPSVIKTSLKVNGNFIKENTDAVGIAEMFDGLNDTFWSEQVSVATQGVVTLTLDIPIESLGLEVSRVDAAMVTSSPSSVYVRCIPTDPSLSEQLFSKKSTENYDKFSFSFESNTYKKLIITIVKVEPDEVVNSATNPYVYRFGFKELMIGAKYYDTTAELVSKPIAITTKENGLLDISTLAIDVQDSVPSGTVVKYYVAADISSTPKSIYDFNWIPIEPLSYFVKENLKYVTLNSGRFSSKTIGSIDSDLLIRPLNESTANSPVSSLNPFVVPYSNVTAFSLAYLNSDEQIISPYILSGVNIIDFHAEFFESSRVTPTKYKDPSYWVDFIKRELPTMASSRLKNQLVSTGIPIQNPNSGVFSFKLMCDQAISVTQTLTKQNYDFNLSVYLNGALIADVPSGTISSSVEWNFNSGINSINIYYDKPSNYLASFNLMTGTTIQQYGTVFLDYYNYIDPIEFRRRASESISVFTIDKIYDQRQILTTKRIDSDSVLRYITDKSEKISAVRYRASLKRFNNPLQTPSIDSVRVRFKNT